MDVFPWSYCFWRSGHTGRGVGRRIAVGVLPDVLGPAYFRVFRWAACYYTVAMPGTLYRSPNGLSSFVEGPSLFTPAMRHSALFIDGDVLNVIYSNAGDAPEQLLLSRINLQHDWLTWHATEPKVLLSPEERYEGGDLPVRPPERGMIKPRVRQLRDPAVIEEDDRRYLVYVVAGERGLALAELRN